jgi:hypothetical protein
VLLAGTFWEDVSYNWNSHGRFSELTIKDGNVFQGDDDALQLAVNLRLSDATLAKEWGSLESLQDES